MRALNRGCPASPGIVYQLRNSGRYVSYKDIKWANRQLRKVTKAKSVFPTDDSLLKMLHLAMIDITKKWTGRRADWGKIHAQLSIYFEGRMPE